MTAKHAGPPVIRPAGPPGRHAAPRCPLIAGVTIPDSDRMTYLACDLAAHDGGLHHDEKDDIWWFSKAPITPELPAQQAS